MRWRYLKIALLGCLLGLAGQVSVDLFCWLPCARTPLEALTDGGLDYTLRWSYPADPARARQLIYQTYFWYWLLVRGEQACRTALLTACLLSFSFAAIDRLRKARLKATS